MSDKLSTSDTLALYHQEIKGITAGVGGLLFQYIEAVTPIIRFLVLIITAALAFNSFYKTFFKKSSAENKDN